MTALVALGAAAGAAYIYQSGVSGATSAASPSQGGTAAPVPAGWALGAITVGGGPVPAVRMVVTSATQFSGLARPIAHMHVGDTVAVQITDLDGVARVVSLQDPATSL